MGAPQPTLLDQLGGRATLERVHRRFYDLLFADPWLAPFFRHLDQRFIEDQQTDFMAGNFGGPRIYRGRPPAQAHQHLFITGEMFVYRQKVLKQALQECGVPVDLARQWIRVDSAFRKVIVKGDLGECVPFAGDGRIVVLDEIASR
jgi:hemoglobin